MVARLLESYPRLSGGKKKLTDLSRVSVSFENEP